MFLHDDRTFLFSSVPSTSKRATAAADARPFASSPLVVRADFSLYISLSLCGNERVVIPPIYLLFVFSTSLDFASHCITYHSFFSCSFRSQPRSPTQWRGYTYRTTLSTLIRDEPSRRFQIHHSIFLFCRLIFIIFIYCFFFIQTHRRY